MSGLVRRAGSGSIAAILVFGLGLGTCTLFRLARLFPNNDPVMAATLPYAKRRSWWMAMMFPAIAILVFDVASDKLGVWTAVTASTYGLLGLGFSAVYSRLSSRGRHIGSLTYLVSGVIGVLIFDFITGPIMSSTLFGLTFRQAVIGQVPFTLLHLASVSAYAVVLSPLIERAFAWTARLDPIVARLLGVSGRASIRSA